MWHISEAKTSWKNLMKFVAGILDRHINLPKKKEIVFGYRKEMCTYCTSVKCPWNHQTLKNTSKILHTSKFVEANKSCVSARSAHLKAMNPTRFLSLYTVFFRNRKQPNSRLYCVCKWIGKEKKRRPNMIFM